MLKLKILSKKITCKIFSKKNKTEREKKAGLVMATRHDESYPKIEGKKEIQMDIKFNPLATLSFLFNNSTTPPKKKEKKGPNLYHLNIY